MSCDAPHTIAAQDQYATARAEAMRCGCPIRQSRVGTLGGINTDRFEVRHHDNCPHRPAWQEPDLPEINESDEDDEQ